MTSTTGWCGSRFSCRDSSGITCSLSRRLHDYRTLLVVVSVALAPVCVPAQELNPGYDKIDPIVLTIGQEYAGSTDADRERKYFMAHVEAGVEYRLDLTGLSVDLDLYYKGSDATFCAIPWPGRPMPTTTTSGYCSRRGLTWPTSCCTTTTSRNRNSGFS